MKRKIILSAIVALMAFSAAAFAMSSPPASPEVVPMNANNEQEIRIIAKQFEFVPSSIIVKKGIPVRIILTSPDVTHGFAIDEFKLNSTVEKGKETIVGFTPERAGTYVYYCSVFCGVGHMGMQGKLIVQ